MSPIRMEKIESAMRAVLAFTQAQERRDVDAMLLLMTEDCVYESASPAPGGTLIAGKDAVRRYWQETYAATLHSHVEIEEVLGMGSRCFLRWRREWQAVGDASVSLRGVDIYHVKDGLIREILSYIKG